MNNHIDNDEIKDTKELMQFYTAEEIKDTQELIQHIAEEIGIISKMIRGRKTDSIHISRLNKLSMELCVLHRVLETLIDIRRSHKNICARSLAKGA